MASESNQLVLKFFLYILAEDECEEWKTELTIVCSRIKNISGAPSSASIWVTSTTGDIYVCDLLHAGVSVLSLNVTNCTGMRYRELNVKLNSI